MDRCPWIVLAIGAATRIIRAVNGDAQFMFNESLQGGAPTLIHQYWNSDASSWSMHLPPAWPSEEDQTNRYGPSFYAYDWPAEGTEEVHAFWNGHCWSSHFPPAGPDEEDKSGADGPAFYAFKDNGQDLQLVEIGSYWDGQRQSWAMHQAPAWPDQEDQTNTYWPPFYAFPVPLEPTAEPTAEPTSKPSYEPVPGPKPTARHMPWAVIVSGGSSLVVVVVVAVVAWFRMRARARQPLISRDGEEGAAEYDDAMAKLRSLMLAAGDSRKIADELKFHSGRKSAEFNTAWRDLQTTEALVVDFVKTAVPFRFRSSKLSEKDWYVLASGPEYDQNRQPTLALTKRLMQQLDFDCVAGDAKDAFHVETMSDNDMSVAIQGWRLAWKGKLEAGVNLVSKHKPGKRIVLATIDGGPECCWELKEVTDVFIPMFRRRGFQIDLERFSDWKSFVQFFLHGL